MCGIGAVYNFDKQQVVQTELLESINRSQHHRGPDGQGQIALGNVGLAHTRLAIIDIHNGHQPMADKTGRVYITYNGELYNFKQLKNELEGFGYTFTSNSDTEVLLNAWLEWQEECVHHFDGMFAFVIWDSNKNTLFAARDHLGIKPLHWYRDQNRIIFTSEIKGIIATVDKPLKINFEAIHDFLSLGYIIEPKSIYKEIYKLQPGCHLVINQGNEPVVTRYWSPPVSCSNKPDINQLTTLIRNSVDSQTKASDVQVGAFLSGGLDSTIVVSEMSKHNTQLPTFHIDYNSPEHSEKNAADYIAQHFATKHTSIKDYDFSLEVFDRLIEIYDEPFADNSAYSTFLLCQEAKKVVNVILSGDGSDELFFGYRNYQTLKLEQFFRNFASKPIYQKLQYYLGKITPEKPKNIFLKKLQTLIYSLANAPLVSHHQSMSIIPGNILDGLTSRNFHRQLNGYNSEQMFLKMSSSSDLSSVKQAQLVDIQTYLNSNILLKVDRASMASSLEVRVPFLNKALVDYAVGLPEESNLNALQCKKLLKLSFRKLLPKAVIRRKKQGFTSPVDSWIRTLPLDKLVERIKSPMLAAIDVLDIELLEKLLIEHRENKNNYGNFIWAVLLLEVFLRKNADVLEN